jgi:hypothetical protein
MEPSILISVKKVLGIAPEYLAFDQDVLMHINTAISTLTQLGIGPIDGYTVDSVDDVWDDFISPTDHQANAAKSYIFLRVRMLFDPPQTSYLIDAMTKQVQELEWRLNIHRETMGG